MFLFCFWKRALVSEYQSPKFKDIQKLIANKLEQSTVKNESNIKRAPSAAIVCPVVRITSDVQRKVAECLSGPPPPPPPPPSRPLARAATARKAPAVVQLYHSFARKKDVLVGGNHNKISANSAHNSIVGEIQNRSAHLLAVSV